MGKTHIIHTYKKLKKTLNLLKIYKKNNKKIQ